jgi:hypothetical protein
MSENRFNQVHDDPRSNPRPPRQARPQDVHHIRDVLAELLDQYEVRFPGIHVTVVETPPCAA